MKLANQKIVVIDKRKMQVIDLKKQVINTKKNLSHPTKKKKKKKKKYNSSLKKKKMQVINQKRQIVSQSQTKKCKSGTIKGVINKKNASHLAKNK